MLLAEGSVMILNKEGWYQHSCGHEEFYWPEEWFPNRCRRCHKTNLRWVWVEGYVFQPGDMYRDVMVWLIKRDKDLAAEFYIALTEGRFL
jgi:hypothetical protein